MAAFDMQEWLNAYADLGYTLTQREARVLIVMQRYATYDTGRDIRPSASKIAERAHVSPRMCKGKDGILESLAAKGWITRTAESTKTRPAVYALTLPQAPVRCPPRAPGAHGEHQVPNLGTCEVPAASTCEVPNLSTCEVPTVGTQPTQDLLNDQSQDLLSAPAPEQVVQGVIVFDQGDDVDPDAEARELAEHLADVIGGYASQRPTPTRKWIAAFTNLMARDNITRRQVEYVIDYLPRDDFWPGVIFDAPKFVEKYDQVSVKAKLAYRKDHTPNRHMDQKQRMDDQKARWRAEAIARDAQLDQKAITA